MRTEQLSAHFADYVKEQQYSGVIAVARAGEIVFQQAYGTANYEHRVPVRTDTKFYIASITKPMTAMAVLMLKEAGKLELNQSVRACLPEVTQVDERITLHQLLTHTSGLPDFELLGDFQVQKQKLLYRDQHILELVEGLPLDFEPGTGWKYCNTGYNLLGMVIERTSGTSYSDFLRARILEPLGMNDTGFGKAQTIVAGLASGYTQSEGTDGRLVKATYFEIENFKASGHMYSTAADLLRWEEALRTTRLVSADTLALIFSPHAPASPGRHYGYGWSIYGNSFGHGGWLPGYWCKFRQYPAERLTVVMLSNHDHTKENDILDRTFRLCCDSKD
ncbi:serine hydrolase domain-containing protein [Paenibacillus allorhizosphaerae]|uniref:Penicillin-binding protein 4 n=1 Tax=Paenibacillus allorhizosphaerae TaxID=2849866 RepID=A0ABM8VB59_9BACL|nr:serine hydrolase domain-containing protein [Paenibacillus allorhizosphaerae]CAG7618530.1 Penicillin-binding protein 4* [Paenibacillus allorhizosphaerae]